MVFKVKILSLLFCCVAISIGASAQAPSSPPLSIVPESNSKVLFTREKTFGAFAHTTGWGLNYRVGKNLTGKKRQIYSIELSSYKNPKEYKISNNNYNSSGKKFSYGKLNNVFFLRGGWGIQKVLYDEEIPSAIQVRALFMGGPVIAIAKPYYIEYMQQAADPKYLTAPATVAYDPTKHTIDSIYGRASFLYGFTGTKFYPGVFGKMALSFEYSSYEEVIRALETGITVDVIPQGVPNFAFEKRKPVFINLYLSLLLGKKWY